MAAHVQPAAWLIVRFGDRQSAVVAGAAQAARGQVGEGGVAVHGHDQVCLGQDAAQDVDDAVGAADRQAVGVGPAHADRGGAQREGLDHVGAGADTGVEEHGCTVRGLHHAGQAVDRRQPAVGLPPAVGRAVDAVDPAVDRAAGVVGVADALDQQGQRGQ